MAGPRACRSLWRNPSPAGKDELVGAAPTGGSKTPTPTTSVSRAPTPAPAIILSSDNKLFKQFMKAYLEAQVPG